MKHSRFLFIFSLSLILLPALLLGWRPSQTSLAATPPPAVWPVRSLSSDLTPAAQGAIGATGALTGPQPWIWIKIFWAGFPLRKNI